MSKSLGLEAQIMTAADAAWAERWQFVKDANGDGLITISDAMGWLGWVFFAPGDWLLLMLMSHAPSIALFFEITPAMLYGTLSGIVSPVIWISLLLIEEWL